MHNAPSYSRRIKLSRLFACANSCSNPAFTPKLTGIPSVMRPRTASFFRPAVISVSRRSPRTRQNSRTTNKLCLDTARRCLRSQMHRFVYCRQTRSNSIPSGLPVIREFLRSIHKADLYTHSALHRDAHNSSSCQQPPLRGSRLFP
jgi:hypothetical protein